MKKTYTTPATNSMTIETATIMAGSLNSVNKSTQADTGSAGHTVNLGKEDFTPVTDGNGGGSLWED